VQITFAGTPVFAATILCALLDNGYRPTLVLTQPDRPQGRGRRLSPSAVKSLAIEAQIETFQPSTLRGRSAEGLAALDYLTGRSCDVLIVAAYGLILPKRLLAHPTHGALNVHASLLPRWRGASPVEYAIMAGDQSTGISLMQMDAGLDTGPVLTSRACPIGPDVTGGELTRRLADMGGRLLCETLPRLGSLAPIPQNDALATYAPKLTQEIARIDWSQSALAVHNLVRALSERLTAHGCLAPDDHVRGNGTHVKVLAGEPLDEHTEAAPGTIVAVDRKDRIAVACAAGVFGISRLQLSLGKGTPMSAAAALNGFSALLRPGARFLV